MSNLESGNAFQRTAVGVRGMDLARLTFQALGIIYSDLGTSPLYALNGIWPSSDPAPSQEDVIGGVSAIIWAITLVALLKYVIISLRFATREGEGGSFALFQGLYPRQVDDGTLERTLTGDYGRELKRFDQPKKPSVKERIRWPLLIWCLFGTALMMSDGIFTPAVSVTSAVGGIAVAKPDVADNIVPIAIGFILLIFLVQQFGTARLAVAFSPIALVWFGLLMGTGIYNITYHPGIFRAFDPSRAILLFVRTKNYDLLSGVLLALTGCEAVFANVGQFNALSIQLSFGTVVYPAVLFSYLGQGARLISNGDDIIENIFYRSIPGPVNGALFWIMFVFAILATLIASQALITATFSLLQQLIVMKSFPPLRMTYTSETMQGQVYISAVNWTLMISTIIVVAAFPNLRAMTNAYGFAVATVMLSTSVLIAIHIRYVKKFSIFLALAYVVFFGFLDALLWGASLKKVPEGAWVPLLIGGCLAISMCLWTWGKGLEDAFDAKNRQNLAEVVCFNRGNDNDDDELNESDDDEDDEPTLLYTMAPRSGANKDPSEKNTILERRPLVRTRNCAIFHKFTEGKGVPHSFIGLIRQWPSLPEVMIFLSVRIVPIARVPPEDRYIVSKTRSIPGCYGATYCVGFREKFNINNDELLDKICALERSLNSHHGRTTAERIRRVSGAVTHIVPYYYVISRQTNGGRLRPVVNWVRKALIENVYRRLATMFPQTANWNNSADEIIHVGINAII